MVSEDRSAPVVCVNLWYDVGSRHEPAGQTGFAHLFEHLMFEGSVHVAKTEHMRLVQGNGGSLNATTNPDRTNYFETLPSEHLELALWLEADRMGGLVPALTQETLDNQREVVKNERRQRYENVPYGDAWLRLLPLLYPPGHPYHHATIGSMEDLNAAEPGHLPGVPPALLRAEQRGAHGRRRRLAGRGVRAGGQVLRRAASRSRTSRRHPDGHIAGPATDDRSGRRSPPTCRRRGSTWRTAPTRSAPPGTTRSPCSPRSWAAAGAAGSTSGSPTARGSPSRTTSARTASTWRTPRPR